MDARRSINTRVWSDSWFEELDSFPKLLWLHLLTNQQTNLLGIYEISPRRISNETGITPNDCQTILKGFEKDKKAFYKDGYILIPNWIKNQQMNANMMISAKKIYESLPDKCKIWIKCLGFDDFESLANGSPTLTEPWGEIEIEIEREIEKEKEKESENFDASVPEATAPVLEKELSFFSPDGIPIPNPDGPEKEKKKLPQKKKSDSDSPPKKPPSDIPELEEFMEYARSWMTEKGKDFEGKRTQIESKYYTWKDSGWKDGFGSPIKDWKGKIRNTEPYLKSDGKNTGILRRGASQPVPGKGFGTL